ncbi:MAG: peptidoglycan glycosyltransferase, partial [Clostridia bacterium]|nr:peptidoglycan glycosyltransferase [Clostridia bacterium]
MDVNNGELLASAIYPSFDLNNYNNLSEFYQTQYDVFVGTEDERSEYKSKLLYEMWNNTIATQTYEPGSTFKIITSAIALEEGSIDTV